MGKIISLSDHQQIFRVRAPRRGRIVTEVRELVIRDQARDLLARVWRALKDRHNKPPSQILPVEPRWFLEVFSDWTFEEPPTIGSSKTSGREIAGALDRVKKKIEVASNLPPSVRRFTGAHELGHLVLHPRLQSLRESPLDDDLRGHSNSPAEREANIFAAEYLMPRRLLRDHFQKRFGGIIDRASITEDDAFFWTTGNFRASQLRVMDPVELAKILARVSDSFTAINYRSFTDVFGVSDTAMAIQMVDTGLVLLD
jgi:hypothetical protein